MQDLVKELAQLLNEKSMMITTAESCTGGLLSAALTHKPGASSYFDRGFITYSNEAKQELLNVPESTIQTFGAVSEETAQAMAKGALENSHASIAISITGIAGPDGGSNEKPVGTVIFGYALKGGSSGCIQKQFSGSREDIQSQSTVTALKSLISILSADA